MKCFCDIPGFRLNLASIQPKLCVEDHKDYIKIRGHFIVNEQSENFNPGGALAEFAVCMKFDKRYPKIEPKIYEINADLKNKNADELGKLHINCDGTCCITIWEHWLVKTTDKSPLGYINGPVRAYFLGRCGLEATGNWLNGEWKHGEDGIMDAYAELFEMPKSNFTIKKCKNEFYNLLKILSQDFPKGHFLCLCGSGQKIRDCHREEFSYLHKKIKPKYARLLLDKFLRHVSKPKTKYHPRHNGRNRPPHKRYTRK